MPERDRALRALVQAPALRYLATGALLFALDLAIFLALTRSGLSIHLAQWVSRSVGAAAGFVLHKYLSFHGATRAQDESAPRQAVAYLALSGINLLISPWVVSAAISACRGEKVVAEVLLVAFTFLCSRRIFRPAPDGSVR